MTIYDKIEKALDSHLSQKADDYGAWETDLEALAPTLARMVLDDRAKLEAAERLAYHAENLLNNPDDSHHHDGVAVALAAYRGLSPRAPGADEIERNQAWDSTRQSFSTMTRPTDGRKRYRTQCAAGLDMNSAMADFGPTGVLAGGTS